MINQSIGFENIELILYDDNSSDNSRKIILEYANKFNNIIPILSKHNSGFPGKGRNIGIKRATAKYIMFMDNDDEYKLDYCETMYNAIIKYNADIISCNNVNKDLVSSIVYSSNYLMPMIDYHDIIIFDKDEKNFDNSVIWNKIFKKDLIEKNNIKFPEDSFAEDGYFAHLCYMHSKKLIYLKNYVGYIRHVRTESSSRNFTHKQIDMILQVLEDIIREFKKNNYNPNTDFLFKSAIQGQFRYISTSEDFLNKKQTINTLKKLYHFEKNINFDTKLNIFYEIPNFLLNKKLYGATYYYLKLLRLFLESRILKKIYRILC